MCGPHQSDGNPTLAITSSPRVGLSPLCGQATGYSLQGSRRLHNQKSINRDNKGGEVPALLDACLQVYLIICPLCLLQAFLRGICRIGLFINVHNTHVVNTLSPIMTEVMDCEVSPLFCGLWRWRIVLVGWTFGPDRLKLCPLHGATYKDEGVMNTFLARSATLSHSSLWRAVTRPPLLWSREWQIDNLLLQPSQ